ncbi:hypothetical protein GQ54DRAFT_323120, partial [Martensiomyces pterosporus]
EDYTYTNETLPKILRQSVSDYPDEESKAGTYNPPLIYRRARGRWIINTVPVESMPRPTNSNGRSSSPANTARITSFDVELKIQGISQGWVRGEDAIVKLAEPKFERKTMTITRRPHHHRSESNMAHGNIHSGQFRSARSTATASRGNIGSARPSNNDLGRFEGYKNEVVVSTSEGVTKVEYMACNSNFLPSHILCSASVLSVILLMVSTPLVAALLLTPLGDIVAFWSREGTKWEGTSQLAVIAEVVYQCGNLVIMYMGYRIDTRIIPMRYKMHDGRNILVPVYASLSLWAFALLYNIPLNPFKWRQRIARLRAPASSEITKPVLAEDDEGSSTTIRAGELRRMHGHDLAASTQQEVDQLFKKWLRLSFPSLVVHIVYTVATSRGSFWT